MADPKIINIDNKEYPLDSLSDLAKKHLMSLRAVDREIGRLKVQLAIAQTARSVVAGNVKSNLPDSKSAAQ